MYNVYKVKMSDQVNGNNFSFSSEYVAEDEFSARVLAYREFGDSKTMQIDETHLVEKFKD